MNTISRIQTLKTEHDYEQALAEIDALLGAQPHTPEGERLDALVTLVEAYEREHYPMGLPDPISAIEYHMESRGITAADLEPYIGSRADALAVLTRTKALTLDMIRKLHHGLEISADILIQEYPLLTSRRVSFSSAGASEDAPPVGDVPASDAPANVFSQAE